MKGHYYFVLLVLTSHLSASDSLEVAVNLSASSEGEKPTLTVSSGSHISSLSAEMNNQLHIDLSAVSQEVFGAATARAEAQLEQVRHLNMSLCTKRAVHELQKKLRTLGTNREKRAHMKSGGSDSLDSSESSIPPELHDLFIIQEASAQLLARQAVQVQEGKERAQKEAKNQKRYTWAGFSVSVMSLAATVIMGIITL